MLLRSETTALPTPSRSVVLAGGLLVVVTLVAYSNSFSGPFIYDDKPAILDNLTLRQLWPPWLALSPPHGGLTVEARPLLNVSFAFNYALGGTDVRGYHLANVLIHALAALVLFGVVRRTFLQPVLRESFGDAALPLAWAIAGCWALHPLQTESVSYIVQRAESLMGLFYLLTLYAFIRSVQSPSGRLWSTGSVIACLLGVGTKEVIVTAPILVLLYDRTFVVGTIQGAWRRRWVYYLALVGTWIPLAWLVTSAGGNRGGSMGFGIGLSGWDHAVSQFEAVAHYLKLSLWPQPLVFDYGFFQLTHLASVGPQAWLVLTLVAGTAIAFWRWPTIGFLGAWFFVILAPTLALPQLIQVTVEHRMYLPLASIVALVGSGLYGLGGQRRWAALLLAAIALGAVTYRRNRDYRSEIAIWQDTLAKRPTNAMAHFGLGNAFADADRTPEAIVEFEAALALQPHYADALASLGNSLTEAGRPAEAVVRLAEALRLKPGLAEAHVNLGIALDRLGRVDEARREFEEALQLKPGLASAHAALGNVLLRLGQMPSSIAQLEEALRLDPRDASAHYTLAIALVVADRVSEAFVHFEAGDRLRPHDLVAGENWSRVLLRAGRVGDALAFYERMLRQWPDSPAIHYNDGTAFSAAGRDEDAIRQYAEAVRLKPDYAEAHNNWGNALVSLGQVPEAIGHYERSLQLKPENPSAHNNLGLALARLGRLAEAVGQFEAAVRQAPNDQEAKDNLARARGESPPPQPRD